MQVLVPIALKPQPMLQSTVHGAPVFASALEQLMSFDEPLPAVPVDAEPAVPLPPAPLVVVVPSPPEPAVMAFCELPEEPEPVVASLPPVPPVVDEVPVEPFTGAVPAPSVLLEHPEGAQR